jgi:hypothetical protein
MGQIIQKLPNTIDDCEETYMKQVAFYWKATGKKAYLGYINSEEYKIFEPEDDRLEYYYHQLVNKAFTIQNLLEVSKGDARQMAKLVEAPDLKNFYYSDLTPEQIDITKQVKGKKVPGMHFNPLQHDEVQKVAMEALLSNGLYPVCTYSNELTDSYIMVTCFMKIHDIDNPTDYIEINGCSAMGNLDKFGTGNGMSYAKKYAFLNALNLKTGMDSEEGYEAKPFKSTKESQAKASGSINQTQQQAGEIDVNIEDIKKSFANAIHTPRLKHLKDTVYADQIKYLQTKNPNALSELKKVYESRMEQLSHK